jgi:hypothetical protein
VSPTRFKGSCLRMSFVIETGSVALRSMLKAATFAAIGCLGSTPMKTRVFTLLLNPAQTTDLADASVICERCRVCEGRNFELLWEARMPPNPVDTRL